MLQCSLLPLLLHLRLGSGAKLSYDLKLVKEIRGPPDCEKLQMDIDGVVEWSHRNGLNFNVSKCSVMTFTRARQPYIHPYHIKDEPLQRVTETKDRGVHFTSDLNFREHIVKACKKGYRNLGFVMRQTRDFTNLNAVRALYEALVKSHLESNACIWAPHETKYKLMVERIQNKFTRLLYLKMYGVYPFYPLMYPTLFVIGMVGYNTLEVRRSLYLATYLFKVWRGRLCNPDVLEWMALCVPNRYVWRRHQPHMFAIPRGRTNLMKKAPLTRTLKTLNEVANIIDMNCCSLTEFTRATLYVLSYK